MTPAQLKRAHVALEAAGGTISRAATILGISEASLRETIRQTPELSSYLKSAEPPSDSETMTRAVVVGPTKEQLEVAEASRKADIQMRQDFGSLGIVGDSLDQAMAFRKFGRMHFQDMRHFIGGGIAKLFADEMADIAKVRKDIESSGLGDLELQKVLREDRSRLVKLALDTYDRVREAAHTAAVIEATKKQKSNSKDRNTRTAFSPLAMQVAGNVTIHEQGTVQPDSSRSVGTREAVAG